MLNSRRSASVGALPAEKRHFVSRVESASGASLDVRCACQFFQCDSLLPERVNPVDSRPCSRQGLQNDDQFQPINLQHDDLSTHDFEVISHEDVAQSVDLRFMERYPELEETARTRGLVVHSITGERDPEIPSSHGCLMAGRRRQLSTGGLSSGNVERFADTRSMRSVTSLRRISAGNSKTDLYCADINIPYTGGAQRSASGSRRTSNADLYQATIIPGTSQLQQLNPNAATPLTGMGDICSPFGSHQVSAISSSQDFRNAKPPLSSDYMRPSAVNKPSQQPGDMLPQNRPIDVSRFAGDTVRPSNQFDSNMKLSESPYQTTVIPIDPLAETVAELEQIAQEHNIVNISDNIQTLTRRRPSILSELNTKPLHVDELTQIEIVSDIPDVDIDVLVQVENQKAAEHRSISQMPSLKSSPVHPTVRDTLHLPPVPQSRTSSVEASSSLDAAAPVHILKRKHTPEPEPFSERQTNFDSIPPSIVDSITVQSGSIENKSSYTSRLKSIFSSKSDEHRQKSNSPQRIRPPSPLLNRSPSPIREKSPSPSKLLSIFKSKPQSISIVSGTANVMKRQEAEPLSVRVTETFSLKVDDMDQYCTRPLKAPPPPPQAQTMYSSREDFAISERTSVEVSEAFAPVVVSPVPRGPLISIGSVDFMTGNRNLFSSEIEISSTGWSQSELDFCNPSNNHPPVISENSRPLVCMPIQISGSGSQVYRPLRAPSEQRFIKGAQSKSPNWEPRTQSHDRRTHLTGSQDQLFGSRARMTKTVSFNFDERKSRLLEFEGNSPLTQKQKDHKDFLERTYFSRDHDYEPVGASSVHDSQISETLERTENVPALPSAQKASSILQPMDIMDSELSGTSGTTPGVESGYDMHTSQVESSTIEKLSQQPENRKKSFMASAQDRTKKMQDGIRNQADKLRIKLRTQSKPKSKPASGSPKAKAKERRRFTSELSKIKMPEIKRPDMSKLKEIKRPEFTKFNKPDISKFKFSEKLSTLKLRRSKSFKDNEADEVPEPATTDNQSSPQKKKFEFNFGTYPRAFRKKKTADEVCLPMDSSLGTEGLSVIPSTETQPSQTSTSSPQGDRGPGPVRSRWADKFSDVSYNDSEGSRYRRYGSELESYDRESSIERRMKEDLEEDTAIEALPQTEMGILGGVADSKQFAEFDEENRAIHEISNKRSREFKRRPMVHQDSDLRSEDSRDAEGWTEKDIQKNKLLRKAELDAEVSYYKYHDLQDGQSTASSGKKVVMETIDDDEFFLRKRGISEDNIQLRQYISEAIREGYDMPNALEHVGQTSHQDQEEQAEQYGDYDVPPPKPRRLHRNYRPDFEDSQEFQRSDYGDDLSLSQNGSDFLPKRPLRKARSRSKYSIEFSQDINMADGGSSIQYFDDDEEYLRPPMQTQQPESDQALSNLNSAPEEISNDVAIEDQSTTRPKAPIRQKKRPRDNSSMEKDSNSFINGFGGRSVSNTFLQPQEDVIVYRTEHEYPHHIPLATPDSFTDATSSRTQRSEDERSSQGAELLFSDAQKQMSKTEEMYVIDMIENDGYAVVRKEQVPKPTPPARRKKFTRYPGERFATLPSIRGSRGSPPPARPPPPQQYTPSEESPLAVRRRSAASLEDVIPSTLLLKSNFLMGSSPDKHLNEDDYEEPGLSARPESPRSNLQSGEVINKMKFRPLPPPPRPPRERRSARGGTFESSSQADSCEQGDFEVEVSTQTDPLPDDFVCEEFEITEDMKVIKPRRSFGGEGIKTTLEDVLRTVQTEESDELDGGRILSEDEQLVRGLQRFRDANQRSLSERSRASSQADRSKSLSRPQTPSSAVIIERRVPTPSLSTGEADDTLQALLIVRPISEADLKDDELRREEEDLRREGLLSDSSVQSKSDVETTCEEDEHEEVILSDYETSTIDLDAAVDQLQQSQLESDYDSKVEDDEVERTLRESKYSDDEHIATAKVMDAMFEDSSTQSVDPLEQEISYALEVELKEEMEKMLAEYKKPDTLDEDFSEQPQSDADQPLSDVNQSLSDVEQSAQEIDEMQILSELRTNEERQTLFEVEGPMIGNQIIQSDHFVKEDSPVTNSGNTTEVVFGANVVSALPLEHSIGDEVPEPIPMPPPRRKSTTLLEEATSTTLYIAEQPINEEITPLSSAQLSQYNTHILKEQQIEAGQIQVSQLHAAQVKADELECKPKHVVQNIELPPGFIEDIVERVKEQRPSLLTCETQTSRQPSSETCTSEVEPPIKPPRQVKPAELTCDTASQGNLDEQTQTDAVMIPPAAYPSVEYLQSLAPLALYGLQRTIQPDETASANSIDRKATHKCRRRHIQENDSDSELDEQIVERPRSRSRRSRTRSSTIQSMDEYSADRPKTVMQAGRQFISACSLELVNIINQLTTFVRGDAATDPLQQPRNISALMMLFILITFGVLVFLLTGRQVHTHHWDYFNPPGNEGRQT